MTLKKNPSSMSDRQLRQTLASLREDVAAPADFRAKLMQRLEREGVIQAPAGVRVSEPSFLARIAAVLTPARLGLAATAALAIAFVLRLTPSAPVQAPAVQSVAAQASAATKPVQVRASSQALVASKKLKKSTMLATAPQVENIVGEAQSQSVQEAVVVAGDQAAAAPSNSVQIATGGPDPKPTIIVVQPSPTPMAQGLDGNSQLRGNVVRASQGEAAVLVYRVRAAGHVRVEIFDRLGKSVAVLRDGDQSAGVYDLRWTGGSDKGGLAPSGIYIMQVVAPGYQVQHKLLLVK